VLPTQQERANNFSHSKAGLRAQGGVSLDSGTFHHGGWQYEVQRFPAKILHLLVAAALLPPLMLTARAACAQGSTGNVYFLTNQTSGNAVMVSHRDAAGRLVTCLIERK